MIVDDKWMIIEKVSPTFYGIYIKI